MKTLYLKGYKWLLSQTQRLRIDFLGCRRYKALAKHVKPFLEKILKPGLLHKLRIIMVVE